MARLAGATIAELKAVTYKPRDSWWTVLLVDPYAVHLLRLATRARWLTPNLVTIAALALGLISAACFAKATAWWLVAGALAYHCAFVLDCIDGKLARRPAPPVTPAGGRPVGRPPGGLANSTASTTRTDRPICTGGSAACSPVTCRCATGCCLIGCART